MTSGEAKPTCRPGDHRLARRKVSSAPSLALERAARLFRALGDGPRLRTLELLNRREWCVTEIAEALGEKLTTISQRLRLLRAEGLVSRRREGTHLFYALADRHVADLIRNALAHAEELTATGGGGFQKEMTAQEGE